MTTKGDSKHNCNDEHPVNNATKYRKAGDTVGLVGVDKPGVLREGVVVSLSDTDIGVQRATPSSPAKINVEVKQVREQAGC